MCKHKLHVMGCYVVEKKNVVTELSCLLYIAILRIYFLYQLSWHMAEKYS